MAKKKNKKRFSLKQICKAWQHMYGEDFKEQYRGLYRYFKRKENGLNKKNLIKN